MIAQRNTGNHLYYFRVCASLIFFIECYTVVKRTPDEMTDQVLGQSRTHPNPRRILKQAFYNEEVELNFGLKPCTQKLFLD